MSAEQGIKSDCKVTSNQQDQGCSCKPPTVHCALCSAKYVLHAAFQHCIQFNNCFLLLQRSYNEDIGHMCIERKISASRPQTDVSTEPLPKKSTLSVFVDNHTKTKRSRGPNCMPRQPFLKLHLREPLRFRERWLSVDVIPKQRESDRMIHITVKVCSLPVTLLVHSFSHSAGHTFPLTF